MIFRCGTTRGLLNQPVFNRYQQTCTTCFTEKQRDLSILMPLRQSVCWRYPQKLQVRFTQHVSKSIRSCSSSRNAYFLFVSANLPPSLIPCLLLLIQPLDFIFYNILPVLNIMMTIDYVFWSKPDFIFFESCTTFRS